MDELDEFDDVDEVETEPQRMVQIDVQQHIIDDEVDELGHILEVKLDEMDVNELLLSDIKQIELVELNVLLDER